MNSVVVYYSKTGNTRTIAELLAQEMDTIDRLVVGPGGPRECKGTWQVRRLMVRYTQRVHWHEAAGIGKKEFKIKYLLD